MTVPGPESVAEAALRDALAVTRTRLANERTLLAYIRTALALIVVGLTFLHFIESGFLRVAGLAAIPAGVLAGWIGIARFARVEREITKSRS